MEKFYVTKPDSTREGPYDKETIVAKIEAGIYKPGCMVWHKGMKDWEPIEELFLMKIAPQEPSNRGGIAKLILIVLLLSGIGGGSYWYYDQTYKENHISLEDAKEYLRRESVSVKEYEDELISSAKYGYNSYRIKCILIAGNISQETKDKAMAVAIEHGWMKNCEALLDGGASYSAAYEKVMSTSPVNNEILEFLKSKATDKDFIKTQGSELLRIAIISGDMEFLKRLLDAGVDINCTTRYNGLTLLQTAVVEKKHDIVAYLLSRGAQIDKCEKDGINALILACYMNDKEMIQLLLKNKANVNHKTKDGYSILMCLILGKDKNQYDIQETAKILIEAGADVNAIATQNNEPVSCVLSLAKSTNDVQLMQLLAEHGAVNMTVSKK